MASALILFFTVGAIVSFVATILACCLKKFGYAIMWGIWTALFCGSLCPLPGGAIGFIWGVVGLFSLVFFCKIVVSDIEMKAGFVFWWLGWGICIQGLAVYHAGLSDKRKDSCFNRSASEGAASLLRVPLFLGADVHAWGGKALRSATENGYTETVKVLLAEGADVNARGGEALRSAAEDGHTEMVKALLAAGADVNAKDDDGWTALVSAAWHGHTETVKVLLAAGADVNAKTKYGDTALMSAAEKGHTETAEVLREAERKAATKEQE